MIIADSFLKSQKARDADFTTNDGQLLYCIVTGFILHEITKHLNMQVI